MKRLILAIALLSTTSLLYGQSVPADSSSAKLMVSKKGTPILPEAKDWSIGFDAKPIFNYIGNMFNNSVDDSLYAGYQQPFIIVGKYMKDANTAYRAMFRIGYTLRTDDAFVIDENSQVAPFATTTDTRSTKETSIALGLGKQMYRGKGRLKGYYGYEAQLLFAGQKQSFEYGNELNSAHPDASLISKDFGPIFGDTINGTNIIGQARVTEAKIGSIFGIGVRGYIGIEYFFAPKISLGAEYGWGPSLMTQGEGDLITQEFDGTNVITTTEKIGKRSVFSFDNDNVGGSIFISAYF